MALIGLGAAIKRDRERRGLTQKDYAAFLGKKFPVEFGMVTRPVITQYESEDQMPGPERITCLEELFEVPPGTFVKMRIADGLARRGITLSDVGNLDPVEERILKTWRTEGGFGLLRLATDLAQNHGSAPRASDEAA